MSKATLSTTSASTKAEVDVPSSQRIHIISTAPTSSNTTNTNTSTHSQCEPWNLQQFLARVATFSSLSWHIKRTDVTPLRCARFGWECIHTNRLQCTGCGTTLEYQTNAQWSRDINDQYAQTFLENIGRTHTAECIWKTTPCDASFEQLPRDHAVLQSQLLCNLSTWTQPNTDNLYTIPTIDPRAKQLMIMHLKSVVGAGAESDSSWLRHPLCLSVVLLSGCGWRLTKGSSNASNAGCFVECRYCNKCVSLATFTCRTTPDLLPIPQSAPSATANAHNMNSSFLNAINEDAPDSEDDDDDEEVMEVIGDGENEEEDTEMTTADILSVALPIHDADSVMRRLSKLGLKMENTRQHNRHRFEIYETPALQKQARFHGGDEAINAMSTPSNAPRLGGAFGGFGALSSSASFGAYRAECSSSIRWPKMSVLTSPAISPQPQQPLSALSPLLNTSQSVQSAQSRKRRKRSRGQMESESEDAMSDLGSHCSDFSEGGPRKKLKTNSNSISKSTSLPALGEVAEEKEQTKNALPRRRRKRKSMDSMGELEEDTARYPSMKRRRIETQRDSSVSTTLSMSSSSRSARSSRSSSLNLQSANINTHSKMGANARRSRKRKFNDVFMGEIDEEEAEREEEEDEDDDLQSDKESALSGKSRSQRRPKRRRLDTPTVAGRLYLDPITAHAKHCPFVAQSVYVRGGVREAGYRYALRLLPRDIAYIRQLAEQNKRAGHGQAKYRL